MSGGVQSDLRAWLAARGVHTEAGGKILCELVECEMGVDFARRNVPTRLAILHTRINADGYLRPVEVA